MALSKQILSPELDLFTDDPLATDMEERTTETVNPLSTDYDTTITFDIKNNKDQCYIDPSNVRLELDCGIKYYDDGTSTWKTLKKDTKVFPINNVMHSMWKDVETQLNGIIINENNSTYPYQAYLTYLLSYSSDYLGTQGISFGWEKDEAGKMDTVDVVDDSPRAARLSRYINSADAYHKVILHGRLVGEIFQQERFLPYGVDIRLIFRRSSHDFVLMGESANKMQLIIYNALLHVDYVKIDPELFLKYKNALKTNNMIIPVKPKQIKTYNIPRGTYTQSISTLFPGGKLPKKLVLCMTTNQAFSGTHNKNPFNFQHFGLIELNVNYAGRDIPRKAFKPDFTNDRYMRSYLSIFQGINRLDKNEHTPIHYDEYKDGFALWCFDFTADSCGEDNVKHESENGTITIDLRFGTALTQAITLIAYAQYEGRLEIDTGGNVHKNY